MIKAIKNQVIVLPNEKVTETETGLAVVGSYNPELGLRRGKVISVGSNCREVKEGDEACYMAFSGRPIHFEGVRYLSMAEEEVVGITVT
jgi:co-chaperonin GroES (HSP10)